MLPESIRGAVQSNSIGAQGVQDVLNQDRRRDRVEVADPVEDEGAPGC